MQVTLVNARDNGKVQVTASDEASGRQETFLAIGYGEYQGLVGAIGFVAVVNRDRRAGGKVAYVKVCVPCSREAFDAAMRS